MLAGDIALLGLDQPLTVFRLRYVGRAALADDLGAQLPRTLGKRKRSPCRVDMTIIRRMQRRLDTIEVIERVQFTDAVATDHLHRKAQPLTDRNGLIKPIHLIVGIGQSQRPTAVPCDGLSRLFLQHLRVEVDVIAYAFTQCEAGG